MIIKDKNKLRSETKSKILVLGFILIILVGLFSHVTKVQASAANPNEACIIQYFGSPTPVITNAPCKDASGVTQSTSTPTTSTAAATAENPTPSTASNPFQRDIDNGCSAYPTTWFTGCLLKVFYYTYFQIPTLLLALSANLFNVLMSVSITSTLTIASTFLPEAWAVVRDLSNIFFILILLYVAIQTILGLGHDTKKVIVWVIIMALLINFSMFFTKVVIDSSNMLALVFYNKLEVNPDRQKAYEPSSAGIGEKDISGEMVMAFNPTKLLTQDSINRLKTISVFGKPIEAQENLPFGLTLGLMFIAGTLMIVAAFAFFVAGAAFLSRLLELWALIIFSPFAFMSYALPKLASTDYIGWDAWSKRLIKTSFMAPIFMFFMYLIFKILHAYANMHILTGNGFISYVLSLILPALMVLYLLFKAVKFAKEGAGKFGEMASSIGKLVGGLALGAATGGTAVALRSTVGRAGAAAANSGWAKKWESSVFGGEAGMSALKKIGGGSFDLRASSAGKSFSGATGINLGSAQKGGFTERREKDMKKRQERAKEVEVGEDEPLKQELNKVEQDLQALLRANSHDIEQLDKRIKSARENASDAATALRADPDNVAKQTKAKETSELVTDLRAERSAIKNGDTTFTRSNARRASGEAATVAFTGNRTESGKSINELEDHEIPHAHDAIEKENRNRRWAYAHKVEGGWNRGLNFVMSGGQYALKRGANEAAHDIRMGTKIKSGGEEHGGGGHAPAAPAAAPAAAHGGGAPAGGGGGGGGHGGGGHP